MKQPKKLQLSHKKLLSKRGYDATKYMLVSENDREIEVIHKQTKERVKVDK